MRTPTAIFSSLIFCIYLSGRLALPAQAGGGEISIDAQRVGGGSLQTYGFQIRNTGEGAVNLIRIEAPESFRLNDLISCPDDPNRNDDYTWSSDHDDRVITCQTSPFPGNPNLIRPGQSATVRLSATAPSPVADTVYSWKIIIEHEPDFNRTADTSCQTGVDVSPPRIVSALLGDGNSNHELDTVTVEFSEDVDPLTLEPEDFKVGGKTVTNIIPESARVYDLLLEETGENETGPQDLTYSFKPNHGLDLYGHALQDITAADLSEEDEVKPKVLGSALSGGSVISAAEKTLTIDFSEEMDTGFLPVVELIGEKFDYKVIQTGYSSRSWSGRIKVPDKDEEKDLELIVSGFRDKSGNITTEPISLGHYLLDTKGPQAILNGLPLFFTALDKAEISVSGQGLEAYHYSLNGAPFSGEIASQTPLVLTGLKEGNYQLDVQGRDLYGNWQTGTTSHKWTVKYLSQDPVVPPPSTAGTDAGSAAGAGSSGGGGGGGGSSSTEAAPVNPPAYNNNPGTSSAGTADNANSDISTTSTEAQPSNGAGSVDASGNSVLSAISLEADQVMASTVPDWRENAIKVDVAKVYRDYARPILAANPFLPAEADRINYFIAYGTQGTGRLGIGERAGILASYQAAYSHLPRNSADWIDLLKIGSGRWPGRESTSALKNAKLRFKQVYQRDPRPDSAVDSNALAIMSYGLRPLRRNLKSESQALLIFKRIFKKTKLAPNDWDVVRTIAYSGAKR